MRLRLRLDICMTSIFLSFTILRTHVNIYYASFHFAFRCLRNFLLRFFSKESDINLPNDFSYFMQLSQLVAVILRLFRIVKYSQVPLISSTLFSSPIHESFIRHESPARKTELVNRQLRKFGTSFLITVSCEPNRDRNQSVSARFILTCIFPRNSHLGIFCFLEKFPAWYFT